MGGSDDGTGTGQAADADAATDHDPEDESAADGSQQAAAKAAAAAAATGSSDANAPAQGMPVISEDNAKSGDRSASTEEGGAGAVSGAGSPRRKGAVLSSPDQAATEPAPDAEVATTTPDARGPLATAAVATVPSPLGAPAAGGGDGAVGPASRNSKTSGMPAAGGGASSKDEQAASKKTAATLKHEKGEVEELLESTVSHTVDCLIYIRW